MKSFVRKFNKKVALIDSDTGEFVTYRDLLGRINSVKSYLPKVKKKLIFCFCKSDVASTIGYLSSFFSSHAVFLLDMNTTLSSSLNLVSLYSPEFCLIPDSDEGSSLKKALEEKGFFSNKINEEKLILMKLIKIEGSHKYSKINTSLKLLLSTSGTTGNPKLIRLSKKAVKKNTLSIIEALKIESIDRAIINLPLYYSYGLSVLQTHLNVGASVVFTKTGIIQKEFWEIISKYKVSSFAGVPSTYNMINKLKLYNRFPISLKKFSQAGGKLGNREIRLFLDQIEKKNGFLYVMYGQTEATARITILAAEALSANIGSVGKAIPGGKIFIKNENGVIQKPGIEGEIFYQGDNVMMGYSNSREDLSKCDTQGESLRTGDIGYLDNKGFLYITGRLKRFSKISGIRINLDDLENQLVELGTYAISGDDNKIRIFTQTKIDDYSYFQQLLSDFCKINKNFFEFYYIDQIPTLGNGKIDYKELKYLAYSKDIQGHFNSEPFSYKKNKKSKFFLESLNNLNEFHYKNSNYYKNIIHTFYNNLDRFDTIEDVPYLPVQLFKQLELTSVSESKIYKTLTSSGTTSGELSRIYLDKTTSMNQTKGLVNIMSYILGKKRLPMLIIDSQSVFKNKSSFNARGAGILGMSNFGRDHMYLLDDQMNLQADKVLKWLSRYQTKPILIFGFTYMVWKYFLENYHHLKVNLKNSFLIHSGGWKNLSNISVTNDVFKNHLNKRFHLSKIYNFYGMVEQVGSVFVECEKGFLHTPNFSDIIIRDKNTLKPLTKNKSGIIQVLSLLPQSYPGHSILTEDIGTLYGEDDCSCERKGKYFKVEGRIPNVQIRGCSDSYGV
ncbi:AMP-binding protein [Bacteriovoracales bacterium]|nr:AMP-binding protein [Bacteriovoracales bacterium]